MGCTQISIDDYRFPDSKRGGASCAEKLETNKYRTSSSVTGLSGPCRLRCESKGRSRSRTSRLLRERTCKKIMEQQCAKPLKWLQLTPPTNTGMGVREKNRKTFSPVADELLDDGRETF
ncbi:hypothetical protein PF007_g9136 [Phytophthora fragariae]|uniref:Uncharacterized protein n=1 Tax=Phytophthora fragariae TaxID=53985 RepID=A0A6A3LES7_9STRA|nr:hypothetical protein PF011_g7967 [Phytophthora fragariae]KAE9117830.1 hypothetical protein PF007_g9136 [Phytophthora fragariae]